MYWPPAPSLRSWGSLVYPGDTGTDAAWPAVTAPNFTCICTEHHFSKQVTNLFRKMMLSV